MSKKLYIVATPIGNINEISKLAISTLNNCNYFFCEDTRNSKKLFNLLDISIDKKHFYSLNAINEKKVIDEFDFNKEEYCLLSDAGYPILSDPGFILINHFINNKWDIQVINGPCSMIHALVSSGFPINNSLFYGFLDHNKSKKTKELQNLKNELKTIVIFESVHRVKETLKLIHDVFDKNKNICIGRELTKVNETLYRDKIENIPLIDLVEKGEFTIVINNNQLKDKESKNNEIEQYLNCLSELKSLISKGEKEKNACKMVAYKYNLKSNFLYNFWQERKNCI